jgi:hypothetical protein
MVNPIRTKILLLLLLFSSPSLCYSQTNILTQDEMTKITSCLSKLSSDTLELMDKDVNSRLKNILGKIDNVKYFEEYYNTKNIQLMVDEIDDVIRFKNDYINVIAKEKKNAEDNHNPVSIADYEKKIVDEKKIISELDKLKQEFTKTLEDYKNAINK